MSHPIRDIAVFIDANQATDGVLEAAAHLASVQNAHLIGLAAIEPPNDAYAKGAAIHDVIVRHQALVDEKLNRVRHALNRVAVRHDISSELRVIPFSQPDCEAALHALYCDLLVIGHTAAPAGSPLVWTPQQVLQKSGVPVLIVPEHWPVDRPIGQRITVTWNVSRQSRRALADALPLLTAAEDVQLLLVDPDRTPDRHGEEPGADMATYLAHHGVQVDVNRIASQDGTIADAIVAAALDQRADLIVFGAYSRPRLSEALLGGVTRTLLADVPLPLFVSH
jgi:nucleotide-binding universal stress UspA family protein